MLGELTMISILLWYIDPLLDNDHEIDETTTIAR
jgi:hypothetical protein